MADPLTKFGLSRRPASEMFGEAPRPKRSFAFDMLGTPDVSAPGWGMAARRGVAEHQAALDEEMALENERAALEDERIARERQREAEAVADEFIRIKEPSAREKFFDENEATMTGSRRYSQLADIRQRQPSYADKTLAKNIANKIDDPDERNVFLSAVSQGLGTLAAREEADRFRIRRQQAARLGEAGYSPDEADEILAKGVDEARVNYAIAQRREGSMFPKDPQAQALEKRYRVLKDRASMEEDDNGTMTPETAAELRRVSAMLDDKYKMIAEPPAPAAAGAQTPPAAGAQTPPAAGAQTPPAAGAQTPPPRSYKDVMATGNKPPTPVAEPQEIEQQLEQEINSPAADESFFTGLISNPNVPAETKQKALEKFRAFAANPPPNPALTLSQVFARKQELQNKLKEAEEEIKFQPVRERYQQAWTQAKGEMDALVDSFAKSLGVDKQAVINSMAAGERLSVPGRETTNVDQGGASIPQLLAEHWEQVRGKQREPGTSPSSVWNQKAKPLEGFADSPFASRLGEKFGPIPTAKTYGDVLDAYLKEQGKAPPTQQAAPVEVVEVATREEVESLPAGTKFKGPDGKIRIR